MRTSIREQKRTELWLLLGAALVTCVGVLLASVALGYPWVRAVRGAPLAAGFILAALATERRGVSRERLILPVVASLCGLGLVTLWRLDTQVATRQLLWLAVGLAAMVITYRALGDPDVLQRYKYVCAGLAVALIGATMLWGTTVNGAKLWLRFDLGRMAGIRLPPVQFQPGEPAKILIAVFLAGFLVPRAERRGRPAPGRILWLPTLRGIGPLVGAAIICVGMFVVQNDLGAALLVFGVFVAMAYAATGNLAYPLVGLVLFAAAAAKVYTAVPHATERMDMWMNPWSAEDVKAGGYQITQGLFCLSEGGVFGAGLGMGFPDALPHYTAETDMIFAVIGEDLGLAGCLVVILLYAVLVYRGLRIAWSATSTFSALLACALSAIFAVQAFTIIGGVLRLVPLTGITLPFISYGGSSLVTNLVAVGLLLAISRKPLADEAGQPTPAASRGEDSEVA